MSDTENNFNNKPNLLVIGAVIVVILAISGYLFFVKFKQRAVEAPVVKEAAKEEASVKPVSLSLSANKKEANIGDLIKIAVNFDLSGRKTSGVDVVIKYDSQIIKIEPINPKAKKADKEGKVEPKDYLDTTSSSFNIFPYFRIDNQNNSILFSALANPQKEITGEGNIATLAFKAVKKGTANIEIILQNNSSVDSNVAYGGKDILGKVSGVGIDIK